MEKIVSQSHGHVALPVDPFEFALVVSVSNQILAELPHPPEQALETAQPNPANNALFNPILLNLRKMYAHEAPEKFVSIGWRLFSLYRLIWTGALSAWVTRLPGGGFAAIPMAVLFVAATLPLQMKTGFDPAVFIASVAECAAEVA